MDINNILIKYFGGKASREELSQLDSWKSEASENLQQMEEMRKIWNLSDEMESWDEFSSDKAWDRVSSRIDVGSAEEKLETESGTTTGISIEHVEEVVGARSIDAVMENEKSELKLFSIQNIMKIAAIGLLLMMSNIAYNYIQEDKVGQVSVVPLHYEANDSAKHIALEDGTKIVLSAHASIDIKENYLKKRNVKLHGNAFFEVARDESSPFTVYTSKGEVKVLGTSFNILNAPEKFEVYVVEGKVAFTHKDRTVTLTADDIAILNNDNIIKAKMYKKNYLSWKDQKLIFRNSQWMDVFKDMSRHYGININYDDISQSKCKWNTVIETEQIEEVFQELELLWNLKYKKVGKGYRIISIGC